MEYCLNLFDCLCEILGITDVEGEKQTPGEVTFLLAFVNGQPKSNQIWQESWESGAHRHLFWRGGRQQRRQPGHFIGITFCEYFVMHEEEEKDRPA